MAALAALRAEPVPAPRSAPSQARVQHAVDDIGQLGQPSFRFYDDRSGLPQNSVQGIAVDARDYLWVATQDGAAHFNGHVWTPVNLPNRTASNYVNAVCRAHDGSLWFGSDQGGVSRLYEGGWTVYTTESGLPSNTVRTLLETRDAEGQPVLWAGTAQGVGRFSHGVWTSITVADGLPSNSVTGLAAEPRPDGPPALWVSTERGVARFDGGAVERWDAGSGLPSDAVFCVSTGAPDRDGERAIWAGTRDGLARFDGSSWARVDLPVSIPDVTVRSVLESAGPDGQPTLWVGTIRGGLARRESGRWMVFNTESGFSTNEVTTLFETGAGATRTLWAGLNGGGVACYDYGRWLRFDERSGLPSKLAVSFYEGIDDDGEPAMWFGTRRGLARFKNGTWTVYDTDDGLPALGIRCILQTESAGGGRVLWIGTAAGLARVEAGRWTVLSKATGLPGSEILSLLETPEPDGTRGLWISTGSGLARLRGNTVTTYDTSNGLPHNRVQCVLETQAADGSTTVWVGTDKGLARLEHGRWRVYTSNDGLANDVVLGMHLDTSFGRRVLWAGTFGGASRLDIDAPGATWESLTDVTTPALPNNTVYGIKNDPQGRLYLFTNKGIARLTPREPTADDPADLSIYTFTTADGLPGNECDIGASMVDSRGRIWAGTVGGVAMLDPSRMPEDHTSKPLVVERVLVDDAERSLEASTSLDYDENDVVFEYALLSYFRGADTRYRTQLVGLDAAPAPWSADTKRVCSNLPDGDYEFRVWGRDYAGNVSGPVAMAFRVRPAPWRTWWAYTLYVVLVAGAVFGLYRYRTESLRRRNEALEAKIRERTLQLAEKVDQVRASEQLALEASRAKSTFLASMSHELRTPLNAILGFVQLMERSPERSPEDREHLSIIARSGEHLLALINDVLSLSKIEAGQLTLNERAFDLPGLLQNLEEMFRLRAQAKGLQLVVEVEPNIPLHVTGDEGKLRQVLINLLGNAFKFTETGGVALRVAWADGVCTFEVEDTGQGISKDEMERLFEAFVQTQSGRTSTEGTGLGLSISRSYVRLMGGEILAASEEGRGTRFTFSVPLAVAEAPATQSVELRVVGLESNQPAYRVLVADDKWENRRLLTKLLAEVGFQVREAATGKEAVDIWTAWRPEIIWMDIQMPEMDGYEATRHIREHEAANDGTRTCILAVTASAFAQERQAILSAGCNDYVPKPFRTATIFEKMAEHAGVRFVYSRTGLASAAASPASSSVTSDRLGALPEDLVARLNRAVVQGDVEQALAVADEICEVDPQLGEELRGLVRSYRFDEILERVARV